MRLRDWRAYIAIIPRDWQPSPGDPDPRHSPDDFDRWGNIQVELCRIKNQARYRAALAEARIVEADEEAAP